MDRYVIDRLFLIKENFSFFSSDDWTGDRLVLAGAAGDGAAGRRNRQPG